MVFVVGRKWYFLLHFYINKWIRILVSKIRYLRILFSFSLNQNLCKPGFYHFYFFFFLGLGNTPILGSPDLINSQIAMATSSKSDASTGKTNHFLIL